MDKNVCKKNFLRHAHTHKTRGNLFSFMDFSYAFALLVLFLFSWGEKVFQAQMSDLSIFVMRRSICKTALKWIFILRIPKQLRFLLGEKVQEEVKRAKHLSPSHCFKKLRCHVKCKLDVDDERSFPSLRLIETRMDNKTRKWLGKLRQFFQAELIVIFNGKFDRDRFFFSLRIMYFCLSVHFFLYTFFFRISIFF